MKNLNAGPVIDSSVTNIVAIFVLLNKINTKFVPIAVLASFLPNTTTPKLQYI